MDSPLCSEVIEVKPGEDVDDVVAEHIDAGCPKPTKVVTFGCCCPGCKNDEQVQCICKFCGKKTCLKHRFPQDHNCERTNSSERLPVNVFEQYPKPANTETSSNDEETKSSKQTYVTVQVPDFGDFLASEKEQESKMCSLIAQRGKSGRLGRRVTSTNEQYSDSVLVCAVCRAHGVGMTRNGNDLMKLTEGTAGYAKIWNDGEKEVCERVFGRACSCAAGIKLCSSDKEEQEHGLGLMISSAGAGDGNGLLQLGLVYERGDVGVEKNETYARQLYEKSRNTGFPDVDWIVGTVGENKKLKPGEKEWNRLLFRIWFNTLPMQDLNLMCLQRNKERVETASNDMNAERKKRFCLDH